jgi:signal transduction histidine kinase
MWGWLAWGLLVGGGLIGYGVARLQATAASAASPPDRQARRRWTGSIVRLSRMQAVDLDEALMQISVTAAHALGVDRTSVWLVQPDQQAIVCREMYHRYTGRHEAGIVVPLAQVSRYLAALDAGRTLTVPDACRDERIGELREGYLVPQGIASLLDVPIRLHGKLVGVLCHETLGGRRAWTRDDEEMAATLGDLASLTWEGYTHKQAAADLRQRNSELQAAQERMDAVLAALAEGLLITDGQGRIRRANAAAAALCNQPLTALLGQPVAGLLPLPAEPATLRDQLIDRDRPPQPVRQLRANRSGLGQGGAVITLRDVTSEEKLNRLKNDFIAIASHELRTPITIIHGYVGLLLMDDLQPTIGPQRRREILTSIRQHADRLSRLIRDVLNVARLDDDTLPAKPERVDVTRQIAEALDLLGPQAQAKGIRLLARHGEGPLPEVWADRGHLLQILTNLMENAIKYSPPDRQVLIEAVPNARMLRISVSDQGIGIPAEEQPHIFARFHRVQTPTMLRERGSGLGLYIARRLAEAQGGTLLVSSQPGIGSTFAVTVPLVTRQTPAAVRAA